MFFLAMGDLPGQWYSVIALPSFLAAVAAVIWVCGRISELKQGGFPWKWFALLPLLLSIAVGLGISLKMSDFLYRDLIEPLGKKAEIAHYAALVIPLLVTVGVVGWEMLERFKARTEA